MKNEKEILNKIKNKIQNPNYKYLMDYNVHNFLVSKTDKSWNLRKCKIVGLGQILRSDSGYRWNQLKNDDIDNTPQILIIQNSAKNEEDSEYSCLLLNPIGSIPLDPTKFFAFGYPTFDNLEEKTDGNWKIENFAGENVLIKPIALNKAVDFIDFLNSHQLKINDFMITNMTNGFSFNYLSDVLEAINKKEQKERNQDKNLKEKFVNATLDRIKIMAGGKGIDLLRHVSNKFIQGEKKNTSKKDLNGINAWIVDNLVEKKNWEGHKHYNEKEQLVDWEDGKKDVCSYEYAPLYWDDFWLCNVLSLAMVNNSDLTKKDCFNLITMNIEHQQECLNKMNKAFETDEKIAVSVISAIKNGKLDAKNKEQVNQTITKKIKLMYKTVPSWYYSIGNHLGKTK